MTLPPPDTPGLVTFGPHLHVGLPAIDRAHASLINALNRLIADQQAGPASELFTAVLTQLGRELAQHFDQEEGTFSSLDLTSDERAAHAAAHGEILSQYAHLNLELMRPHQHSRADLLIVMRSWILDHIVQFDLAMRGRSAD